MPSELERAISFEEALGERCAERIVPFRFGRALFNDTLPLVWDLNVLRVDRPAGATAEALATEADRLQGEAGHNHRRVAVKDEGAGDLLADPFRSLGWRVDRFLVMGWRGAGRACPGEAGYLVMSTATGPLTVDTVTATGPLPSSTEREASSQVRLLSPQRFRVRIRSQRR